MWLFSDFQYGFRSCQSTADLLTVVSDSIARAFNWSGATQAVALNISKAFDGFGMLDFFTNLSLMEFQVRYLALFLFSVIAGFKWFWMRSLHKNTQLMLKFLKATFLVLHFSEYTLMTFLMMLSVMLLSMLMILLSTLSELTAFWDVLTKKPLKSSLKTAPATAKTFENLKPENYRSNIIRNAG